MCTHECACSFNKIICIIRLLYLDILQSFAEQKISEGFAIIIGKSEKTKYAFNK